MNSDNLAMISSPKHSNASILISESKDIKTPANLRLANLAGKSKDNWPIGRILAFGAPLSLVQKIQEQLPNQLKVLIDAIALPDYQEETLHWIDQLSEEEYQRSTKLCLEISRILNECKSGLNIARMKTWGKSDETLATELHLSNIELRRSLNSYVNAVTDLFRHFQQELDFLYPNGVFNRQVASAFFGSEALKRIEKCCNMDIIHGFHRKDASKPLALQSAIKNEADNKRTKVLTNWDHLKRYLYEQFQVQPMLGSIELDEQEYNMVLHYMKDQYDRHWRFNAALTTDRIVAIGLVQIAIRNPSNAYWPFVASALRCANTPDFMQAFGHCFLDTMKAYQKATYMTSEYVASIKLHAFVSNVNIERLYDFLFAYYELDLGRNLDFENLDELRDLMTSGNYFSRRQLILQPTIDALKCISEPCLLRMKTYLSWIDQAFWNQGWLPEQTDRFSRTFTKWVQKNDAFNGQWERNSNSHKRGKRMYTQPTLTLDLRTGYPYMILPVQRLPFDCDEQAVWYIYAGDRLIFDASCTLIESITGRRTEEMKHEFPSNLLFEPISVQFINGNRVVRSYRIAKDLVRIVNAQGNLSFSKRMAPGKTYFLTPHGFTVETDSPGIQESYQHWDVKTVTLQIGETIIFPDKTLAIVGSEAVEGLCGSRPVAGAYMINQTDGQVYPIYAKIPHLLLKTTEEQYQKTRIQIDNHYLSVNDLEYRKLSINERSSEFAYLIQLPVPEQSLSMLHVSVSVPNDRHERQWAFCYMPHFGYLFSSGAEGLPYWNTPRGSVVITSDFIFTGPNIRKDPTSDEYGFEIIPGEPHVLLSTVGTSSPMSLRLDLPEISWREKNNDWSNQPVGDIWVNHLPDFLEFQTNSDEIWMYVDPDGLQNEKCACFRRKSQEKTIVCEMLTIKQWLKRDRVMHPIFLSVGDKTVEFASVFCKSFLASGRLEADYQNNILHGVFDIIGTGNYEVTICCDGEVVLTQQPLVNGEFSSPSVLPTGNYQAIVYEEIDDEFGFGGSFDEIGRTNMHLVNPADLRGTEFKIKAINTIDQDHVQIEFRKNYSITLTNQITTGHCSYEGLLKDKNISLLESLPVRVTFPDPGTMDICQILFDDDGEWLPFLYDYGLNALARVENRRVPYMERYRRYVALTEEDTFTIIYSNDNE